jgi:hypothetical protein
MTGNPESAGINRHVVGDAMTRPINCPSCGQLQQPAETCANDECKADIHAVKSPLHGLRFHDLRHHAITELVESHASERTIMAVAGHISPKLLEHYSHIRMDAKRKAFEALSGRGSAEGYVTNGGTKSESDAIPETQLTEKNGGNDETRTRDRGCQAGYHADRGGGRDSVVR